MNAATNKRALEFEALQGLAGLERLAPEWTSLVDSLPRPRFLDYPQWYRAYLRSGRSDPARTWFVSARRGAELVAIIPLQFQEYLGGAIQPRLLGTIDDDELQQSDFIFAPDEANALLLHDLVQWLRSRRASRRLRWDELRLRKVAEDSSIAHCARTRMPSATVPLLYDGSAYFDCRGSYEDATKAMSGTFKRNLRRLARRAEESAELRAQSFRQRDEMATAFALFTAVEASGWKGDAGTSSAIRCRPAMLAFYRGVVEEFSALEACVINVLWHGDDAVAGQFCLRVGRTLNVLKIGFSDAHASFAPGNLLLERTIRQACEDPGIDYLSLVNEPPWARNFKPLTKGVWSYYAPNWRLRGMLVHLGLLAKRRWDAWRPPAAPALATRAAAEE